MQAIEQGMCSKAQDLACSIGCDQPFCHRGWITHFPIIPEADVHQIGLLNRVADGLEPFSACLSAPHSWSAGWVDVAGEHGFVQDIDGFQSPDISSQTLLR
jgi:hypothetical protein